MKVDTWERVKAIFHEVVECEPAKRADLLLRRCGGDRDLQREVESLLDFDSNGDVSSVLDKPAFEAAALLSQAPPSGLNGELSLTLKDRYVMERELGRGGMSAVYLAQDRQLLSKRVVVKVLLKETSQDPWVRQKFQQEMEALARIDHPGVVGVLDTGLTTEGHQFLVMQYIEGTTLRSVIEPGGMNPARAAGIIRQIGQALAAAHAKGVWHRDLKPENIMLQFVGGEDHVRLIDFGIAGIQNSQFAGEKTKIAGSWTYMAPEQLTGQSCAATDTYALAVVAYEMLTGTPPGTQRDVQPKLAHAAERSILKAMSYRPELRHSEVREFSEELSQTLSGGEPARRRTNPGSIEIAHVLFTSLVDYSMLPMDEQKEYLEQLQQIVRESPQFQAAESAGDPINLPTGDGMALAFFGDPIAPAQCAVELATALKSKPHLKLRMGIHSGPVYRVADRSANTNVAGGGINVAQSVMDCGDAGHILVSKSVADVLLQLSQWSAYLADLGPCTVKTGVILHLYNLAIGEAGNPERPSKLASATPNKKFKKPLAIALIATAAMAVAGYLWLRTEKGFDSARNHPSIAVLPFEDLSAEKNQEYLSDGIAEELLNALAKIPGLRVAGKRSSFKYKGKNGDFRTIGDTLHVGSILEGSVRKQGNRARISVQLIKARDGFQMWSGTYNEELDTGIFAVQDEIARAVLGELKVTLLGEKTPAASQKQPNPAAYNAYLRGRYFLQTQTKENLEKAVTNLEQATKLDPVYAPAWVGLGEALSNQAMQVYVPADEGYRKAGDAVNRALALNSDLAGAYLALGWIKQYHEYDWAGADAAYKRALALEPGNATSIIRAASLAGIMGRADEAVALSRQAMQIDPLSAGVFQLAGITFFDSGLPDESIAALKKAHELAPVGNIHVVLCKVYLSQSHLTEALAEAKLDDDPSFHVFELALVYHALGRKKESDDNLQELIAKYQSDSCYQIAQVYAFRGEATEAFKWLEQAYKVRDSGLPDMKADPLLKSLRADPRFAELLKKLRLPL